MRTNRQTDKCTNPNAITSSFHQRIEEKGLLATAVVELFLCISLGKVQFLTYAFVYAWTYLYCVFS